MSSFYTHISEYLNQAQQQTRHHDYRRQIFVAFLERCFGIKAEDIDVEQFIKIDLRQRGWIDALFRNVLFEFKTKLEAEREDGLRELRSYLGSLEHGHECIGILTDGLIFEVYRLGTDHLIEVDKIDFTQQDPDTIFRWLDAYLFSQTGMVPTTADIVQRYGAHSPTFQLAAQTLQDLLDKQAERSTLTIKLQQWRAVLSKVYGSDIGNDHLFIRHTYLSQFAKLLAYAALNPGELPREDDVLVRIINGEAFHRLGVNNVGEFDFFSWVLTDEIRTPALRMLRRLAQSLFIYDLTQIHQDLFKQLYQNLVDPDTRHDLGEYYTPDWLAELTLDEIDYQPSQSLLDPSCGSGTFLFCALRHLARRNLTGWQLVNFALENVAGMDVHPLAVTIARINYLLAILPHMEGERRGLASELVSLPVYMADALQMPEEAGPHKDVLIVSVDVHGEEKFFIPAHAAESPSAFNDVIDQMNEFAAYQSDQLDLTLTPAFEKIIQRKFGTLQTGIARNMTSVYWIQNLNLLRKLIISGRDSIWAFMLKNTARPLLMATQKFDVIVGNPPWLSYRYIRDEAYQREIKSLVFDYKLLESRDTKLFTQMELATLFMLHCEGQYLKDRGLMAMVMPRSTITGAKQHRAFQARGLTRILDLKEVAPLFNTETCVLIRQADSVKTDDIPTQFYSGKLPSHELSLKEAQAHLRHRATTTKLLGAVTAASPYYADFKQGASLVPRTLCFIKPMQLIKPGDAPFNPVMETDPEVDTEAKAPWKGIRLQGRVYPVNRFATLLSKNLVPFGYRRLHMVALPVRWIKPKNNHVAEGEMVEQLNGLVLEPMTELNFLEEGLVFSWKEWFSRAQQHWDSLKKKTSQFDKLLDRHDYQRTLTSQKIVGTYKVLYNSSGTHLSACVMDTTGDPPKVYEYPTEGFVVDYKCYYYDTSSLQEAFYLSAMLNAPIVDNSIKAHQTRGIYKGARDIQRTPFEACAIPRFEPSNPDHHALVELSQAAHAIIAQTTLTGSVYKIREIARAAVADQIAAIDTIAQRLLGL